MILAFIFRLKVFAYTYKNSLWLMRRLGDGGGWVLDQKQKRRRKGKESKTKATQSKTPKPQNPVGSDLRKEERRVL